MIIAAQKLGEQNRLVSEVCIVGGGAAGIAIAMQLAKKGIDTIVVAGGGYRESEQDRKLYEGQISEAHAHEPLEANRVRALGGSTTAWGGRLVPFDRIDFETRPFVPLSGWPIAFDDVSSYYPAAAALCESKEANFSTSVNRDPNDLPASLLDGAIRTERCERWSTPTNFAVHYRDKLRRNDHIRVLVDYHCVELLLAKNHRQMDRVVVKSRVGPPLAIGALGVVLAAGGLENARLLLASRRQVPQGIGNHSDMVGRCYMGHLCGTFARLKIKSQQLPPFYLFDRDEHGMYVRRRFWLSEEAQKSKRLMNAIAFPFRPEINDPDHHDAILSVLALAEMASDHCHGGGWKSIMEGGHMRQHPAGESIGVVRLGVAVLAAKTQRTPAAIRPAVPPRKPRRPLLSGRHAPIPRVAWCWSTSATSLACRGSNHASLSRKSIIEP